MARLRSYDLIFLYFTCAITVYADTCVNKSPCVCIFPNGTGFDLTPSVSSSFYTAVTFAEKSNGSVYQMSTYFFHPCTDVKLNVTIPTDAGDSCKGDVSVCRYVNKMSKINTTANTFTKEKGSLEYLGKNSDSLFSPKGDFILFHNGPSDTKVLLECAETDNRLHVYSLDEPDDIVLAFYSRDACLKQLEDVGRSLGSTLLIILFSFVIFYLVLGICTKKFLMGATGIEIVPNLAFWSDLPNLVKDGWLFMSNGFKLPARATGQTVSPDPNSYDSI